MAKRKNDSPEKAAMREMMQSYLKENGVSIKSGEDVNSIMRNMMSVLLEGVLDEEHLLDLFFNTHFLFPFFLSSFFRSALISALIYPCLFPTESSFARMSESVEIVNFILIERVFSRSYFALARF